LFICGFGSFAMMFFVTAGGTRTTVPFIISLIIIETYLLYEIYKAKRNLKLSVIFIALLLVFSYFNYLPLLEAYRDKKTYCEYLYKEFSNAKTTGVITIDFDECLDDIALAEMKGRYVSLADTTTFEQIAFYTDYFDIPEDVVYKFNSEKYKVSSCSYNGRYFRNPVIYIDDVPYIPAEYTRMFTGKYSATPQKRLYLFNEDLYVFEFDTQNLLRYEDDKLVKEMSSNVEIIPLYSEDIKLFPLNDFCELFNFKYIYDAENNTFIINGDIPLRTSIYEGSCK
jgi:hypothetical protein